MHKSLMLLIISSIFFYTLNNIQAKNKKSFDEECSYFVNILNYSLRYHFSYTETCEQELKNKMISTGINFANIYLLNKIDNNIQTFDELCNKFIYQDIKEPQKFLINVASTILNSLDPYSLFFNNAQYLKFSIGLELQPYDITQDSGPFIITDIMDASPLSVFDVSRNDIITNINNKSAEEYTLEEFNSISSKQNEDICLTILKNYTEKKNKYCVKSKKIDIQPIYGDILSTETEPVIGYIKIKIFIDKTPEKFYVKYKQLNDHNPIEGLIIDLRQNGGGFIEALKNTIHYFYENSDPRYWTENPILHTIYKENDIKTHFVQKYPNDPYIDLPIIVIVNDSTISAAELFSGILQKDQKAIVIGDRTFGKGTQSGIVGSVGSNWKNIYEQCKYKVPINTFLPEYFFKLTTGMNYFIDGTTPQLTGIIPDIEVKDPVWDIAKLKIRGIWQEKDYPTALKPVKLPDYYITPPKSNLSEILQYLKAHKINIPFNGKYYQDIPKLTAYEYMNLWLQYIKIKAN
jgi:C-terminal peptidase prc